VLVVGCIHGNEPAGMAIASALIRTAPPVGVNLWVVPDLNPDGVARGTRGNADGVDLNRNFPWRWQGLGAPGSPYYAGPRPLSEPESVAAAGLIRRVRPDIAIWFHQHLSVVDASGGDAGLEERFADLVGLPLLRLPRYPGSAVTWANHAFPGTTSFVVELPPGSLSPSAVSAYVGAVAALVARRAPLPGRGG
jgi:protein MpaA